MATADLKLAMIASVENHASKQLKAISGDVDGVKKSMSENLKTAGKWGAGVAIAVGAIAVKAVQAAGKFEASMSNVNTLLGTNQKQYKILEKGVLSFAKNSVKPLEELTGAMYDIVSAGIAQEDQLKVLEESEKLAVAGLGSVKEATDLVTSSMNAFGVDSVRASNAVFEAVKNGKTTVSELAQGFGAVAADAKGLGVQYEEFLAITATGTTVGKKASKVWTEQKAIITALVKPTAEMGDLFEKIGVKTGKELIATSGGLVGALTELQKATEGNDEAFAKALSSAEGLGLANQLLGASAETYTNIMADTTDGVESLTAAYNKQKKTFEAVKQVLVNNLNVAMISLGKVILPMVTSAMEWLAEIIADLAEWFDELSPATQKTVVVAGLLVGVLGATLAAVGLVVAAIPFLVSGFAALGTILALLISPIGLVVMWIGALYLAWTTDLLGIQTNTEAAVDAVYAAFVWLWEKAKAVFTGLGGFFSNWWGTLKSEWAATGDIISEKWDSVWAGVSDGVHTAAQAVKKTVSNMVNVVIAGINKIITTMNRLPFIEIGTIAKIDFGGAIAEAERIAQLGAAEVAGPLQQFAIGGVVNRPTNALLGEAGAEAVVPLPNGRSIPVEMRGAASAITLNFGDVNISNGADAESFFSQLEERLSRVMKLEKLGSLPA